LEKQIKTAHIHSENLLPLITAAAALRKMEFLKSLIVETKLRTLPFKKIYEALLQNYLFTGYPSALLSLKLLKELYPNKRIPKAAKNFSPDMAEWLILEGYGKVLGRKGLSLKERELCIVATLAALKFEDQLYSHINGAFRAKASIEEIRNVIESLSSIGNKNITAFGLRVLNRYKKEKRLSHK
jgi:4-carboxymuconolactone decarboxylase